ncbi:MAG: hypothetical protein HZB46_13180 [Solirubrobacterales bacterium]|nr:hypothetical protein [Solirubrobacterales bacterium]
MLDQLADEEHRLARLGLTSADSMQAVFDDAYGSLSTLAAAVYRRLALHPGPSFTSAAAAATAGVAQDETEDALEELTRAQLLEDDGRRFRLHDLLRLHARETLRRLEPPDDQEAAVRRAVRFYLRNAQRMDHAIIPDRLRLATVPPPSELGDPSFASPAAAFAWFDEERPNLVGALRTAAEHGWDEPAWQFGEALFLGYHNHKHYDEACEVYTLATAAAARAGHLAAEARMRSQLGRARLEAGDEDAAAAELARSQLQAREAGHAGLQASIHEWTGVLELARGDHGAALAAYGEARDGFARLRNRRGTALGLYGLGQALRAAGDHAAAVEALAEARTLIDPAADGLTLGRVMLRLGQAQHAFGDLASAQDALEEAQALMDLHGAPLYVARAREELASVAAAAGQRAEAVRQLEQAFAAYTALRSPRAERVRARLAELSGSAE